MFKLNETIRGRERMSSCQLNNVLNKISHKNRHSKKKKKKSIDYQIK